MIEGCGSICRDLTHISSGGFRGTTWTSYVRSVHIYTHTYACMYMCMHIHKQKQICIHILMNKHVDVEVDLTGMILHAEYPPSMRGRTAPDSQQGNSKLGH